jgi:hypothetical protein
MLHLVPLLDLLLDPHLCMECHHQELQEPLEGLEVHQISLLWRAVIPVPQSH